VYSTREVIAARGAVGVRAELHRPEAHLQGVDEQQAPHQRLPDPRDQLHRLGRLDHPEEPRQDAQDAPLGAGGDDAGRRWIPVEAAETRAVLRAEDRRLPLEPEDGAVDVRLPEEDAGVVGQVAGGEVVGAVHHQVVARDQLQGVGRVEARVVADHLHVRVDVVDPVGGRVELLPPHVLRAVEDLALEVGRVHRVELHEAQGADPGCGEVEADGRAEAAGPDHEDLRVLEPPLAGEPDVGDDQVAAVTQDLLLREARELRGWTSERHG
jgi:hypothetical protein